MKRFSVKLPTIIELDFRALKLANLTTSLVDDLEFNGGR